MRVRERDEKRLLRLSGFAVPRGAVLSGSDEALAGANAIAGAAVVKATATMAVRPAKRSWCKGPGRASPISWPRSRN